MSRYGSVLLALSLLMPACAPRVIVATGTTLGIRATPGDGQTRPPQVVLGYKRAETALIPVEGGGAETNGDEMKKDAASVVASFYLKSEWTAGTEIRSFIGSGFAARNIIGDGVFAKEFVRAVRSGLPSHIVDRQQRLSAQLRALNDEPSAERVLSLAQLSKKTNKKAIESLREYILDATTDADLQKLETAFDSAGTR